MTDLEKKISKAKKKIPALMKNKSWQKSIRKSDQRVAKMIGKLRQDSTVDPELLDQPATL